MNTKIKNKRILITGGLGMIGSTLANKLALQGAEVTILDSFISPYGANIFNIKEVQERIKINISDIRDKESVKMLVRDKEIIINLAGQVSHNDSLKNPFLDTDINYTGHLNVLEAVRNYNPTAKILYSGSRLQFGKIQYNPVDEKHPLNPLTPYAVNKTAAENLYLYYNRVFEIPVVLFRIANPYGPRCQMKHSKYAIINWFIRNAMEDKEITIFGDGSQIRDYIYVDDLADAFILASLEDSINGDVFNIGSGQGSSFREMVELVVSVVGKGKIRYQPWPEDYLNVETGNYITDIRKIFKMLNWMPETKLRDGIEKTFAYYKENWKFYW